MRLMLGKRGVQGRKEQRENSARRRAGEAGFSGGEFAVEGTG
jgi:hypothetical protein